MVAVLQYIPEDDYCHVEPVRAPLAQHFLDRGDGAGAAALDRKAHRAGGKHGEEEQSDHASVFSFCSFSGFNRPSIVGISSLTVGWMCTVRWIVR